MPCNSCGGKPKIENKPMVKNESQLQQKPEYVNNSKISQKKVTLPPIKR